MANHPRVPTEIATGQTCLLCHASGFVPLKDELHDFARNRFAKELVTRSTLEEAKKLHGDQDALLKKLREANVAFGEAETKLGLGSGGFAAMLAAAKSYDEPLDATQIERELGRTEKELLSTERIEAFQRARRESGKAIIESLFEEGRSKGLARSRFARQFASLSLLLNMGHADTYKPLFVKRFIEESSPGSFLDNYHRCALKGGRMIRPADLESREAIQLDLSSQYANPKEVKVWVNQLARKETGDIVATIADLSVESRVVRSVKLGQGELAASAGGKYGLLESKRALTEFDLFRLMAALGTSYEKDLLEELRISVRAPSQSRQVPSASAYCVSADFSGAAAGVSKSTLAPPEWVAPKAGKK